MTIIGLGMDATEIPRVERVIADYGDRFLRRIFTAGEIDYCSARRRSAQHYAARFAIKEAAMKALGTGRSRGVLWRDIEVVRKGGPPHLRFHGGAARRFEAIGGRSSAITITHTDTLALAQVILLGDPATVPVG
jgi:holo-[acyl-carrier protein] synthase